MNMLKRAALAAIRAGFQVPLAADLERFAFLVALRDLLQRQRVDCVFDVGGNTGQFGRDLRGIGFSGWIVSFEPSPDDLAALRSHADPKWISFDIALSDENGERQFNLLRETSLNSFHSHIHDEAVRTISVQTRRLDGLIDDVARQTRATRMFLKVDTQGHDVPVVIGAGERIREFRGLLSELSISPVYDQMTHYLDALRLYESLGFTLDSLHPVWRNPDRSVVEYDGIMERRSVT